jgi:hypothetical protein
MDEAMLKTDDSTFGFAILIHLNAEEPTLAASHGGIMPPIAEFLEMDSHHPEAGALFAAVTFLESFLSRYPNPMQDPPDFPLQITLDNKSVIQDTDRHYDDGTGVYDFLHADYDILQGIKATRARLPLKTSVAWVKGHQDDHKPSQLSRRRRLHENTPPIPPPRRPVSYLGSWTPSGTLSPWSPRHQEDR